MNIILQPPRVWVISDTHFGHARVIEFSKRPYSTADEMDEDMIARWNAVVQPNDIVWHLGDFSWHDKHRTIKIFNRLNGTINLIRGNHDQKWIDSVGFNKISQYEELHHDGKYVILFHYPIADWNGQYHGSYHLYGHVHGNMTQPNTRSQDVGVDVIGFSPVLLDTIIAKLTTIEKPKGNRK